MVTGDSSWRIEAPIVDIGSGSEQEFARAGNIKGAILLAHSEIGSTWADLFDEYLRPPAIIARAVQGGASAILWTSARERLLMYVIRIRSSAKLTRFRRPWSRGKTRCGLLEPSRHIPARFVRGSACRTELAADRAGKCRWRNSRREKPDEVVILAAHLDSWELGTGALDNGCNAALVIEAARAIKPRTAPRRTIRFILFSGEEQGTVGSYGYVTAHRAELDKMRAVIVYDTGSGRVTGYSLGGRKDIEAGVKEVLKPLDSWGATNHTADASFGTGQFDFLLEGVPNLVANQKFRTISSTITPPPIHTTRWTSAN